MMPNDLTLTVDEYIRLYVTPRAAELKARDSFYYQMWSESGDWDDVQYEVIPASEVWL
jgi:hypothetical protein